MDEVLKLLLSGGGGALVAAFLIRQFGENWIKSKFEKQLDDARHDHAKELQRLRNSLDFELNRMNKVLEKEFTVLPKA